MRSIQVRIIPAMVENGISGSEQQKAVENYNNKVEAKFKELELPEKLDKKYISDRVSLCAFTCVSVGNSQADSLSAV